MKVLAITAYYLPGYKAGGPVRSMANLVDRLGGEIDFRIVAADRDLGDSAPYSHLRADIWQSVGKAQVRYLRPIKRPTSRILRYIREYQPDLLYLNSFFNHRVCAGPLVLRACGLLRTAPVLIAPRGEFSPGALAIRRWKKQPYLAALRRMGFLRELWWHATSDLEREDIERAIGPKVRIIVAPNLGDRCDALEARRPQKKQPGALRLVFLARISPKKNLLGALELLKELRGEVQLDVWGPIEDANYWQRCRREVERLPANVRVAYCGAIEHAAVRSTVATYDALLFPTFGENYGHVIVEALTAGCPVVVSDRTPWRNLNAQEAGWDLSLGAPAAFRVALTELLQMNAATHLRIREGAWRLGRAITEDPRLLDASRALFQIAAGQSPAIRPAASKRAA